jgi:ubiquinone/menaquinone biosynthesis C-methylase UbiE
MSNQTGDQVRKTVSQAYAEAITSSEQSCCAPSCCSGPDTAAAERIGYSPAELEMVPSQAAGSSFGCGNPLAFADVEPGQTVIDLGSGAGLDLLLASRAVGPTGKVIGIDMTDEMIETARRNLAAAGVTNVEVRKGIIEELPVDDESVDWVISNCVINLSPEKQRVFAEIQRVLKPGGTMQVSDIVVQDLPQWARERKDLFTACVGGAISEEEYLQGLREAGLADAEVTERVVYEYAQINAFLETEELPVKEKEGLSKEQIASSLAGKVWSAKIRARKPEAV